MRIVNIFIKIAPNKPVYFSELQNTINSNSEKENVDFQSYFMHTVHHDCGQIFEKRVKKTRKIRHLCRTGPKIF